MQQCDCPAIMRLTLHFANASTVCPLYFVSRGCACVPCAPTNGRVQLQAGTLNTRPIVGTWFTASAPCDMFQQNYHIARQRRIQKRNMMRKRDRQNEKIRLREQNRVIVGEKFDRKLEMYQEFL